MKSDDPLDWLAWLLTMLILAVVIPVCFVWTLIDMAVERVTTSG